MVEVQEIKVKRAAEAILPNWADCKKESEKVEMLGLEIEELLNQLAEKYKELNNRGIKAYQEAPKTDCGYGVSPLSNIRFAHAMKAHLLKHGVRVDNYHFGDEDKLPDFSKAVNDGVQWLLKFSK